MFKLIDLWRARRGVGTKFFTNLGGMPVDLQAWYNENHLYLDEDFVSKYRNWICLYDSQDVTHPEVKAGYTLSTLNMFIAGMICRNEYKYTTLFNSMYFDYDPIENYNRTERTETEYLGKELNENVKNGSETDNVNMYGKETDTLTKSGSESNVTAMSGKETDTLTKSGSESNVTAMTGKEKDTTIAGAKTNTSQRDVSADDVSTYSADTLTTDTLGASTDTTEKEFTNRQNSDTLTFINRTDTSEKEFTNRQNSDTLTFNSRTDTQEKEFTDRSDNRTVTYNNVTDSASREFENRKDITVNTTRGNIGVTTSQQMLQSERDIAMFSFWQVFVTDVITEFFVFIDEELTEEDYVWTSKDLS